MLVSIIMQEIWLCTNWPVISVMAWCHATVQAAALLVVPSTFILSTCWIVAVASLMMVWMGEVMIMNGNTECDGKRYVEYGWWVLLYKYQTAFTFVWFSAIVAQQFQLMYYSPYFLHNCIFHCWPHPIWLHSFPAISLFHYILEYTCNAKASSLHNTRWAWCTYSKEISIKNNWIQRSSWSQAINHQSWPTMNHSPLIHDLLWDQLIIDCISDLDMADVSDLFWCIPIPPPFHPYQSSSMMTNFNDFAGTIDLHQTGSCMVKSSSLPR